MDYLIACNVMDGVAGKGYLVLKVVRLSVREGDDHVQGHGNAQTGTWHIVGELLLICFRAQQVVQPSTHS